MRKRAISISLLVILFFSFMATAFARYDMIVECTPELVFSRQGDLNCMVSVLSVPALAVGHIAKNEENLLVDSTGNLLEFDIVAENSSYYTMHYYVNGVVEKIYYLPKGESSKEIEVVSVNNQSRYAIEESTYVESAGIKTRNKFMPTHDSSAIDPYAFSTFGIQYEEKYIT